MPHIPVHPSAEKRHRQSLKRQVRNRLIKTRTRTAAKNALETIAGKDPAAANQALRDAASLLQKAASKGVAVITVHGLGRWDIILVRHYFARM